jgi:hypothetical protein
MIYNVFGCKDYCTGIGAVAEDPVLIAVIHEILDVPHLVMDSHEIFLRNRGTHFDATQPQ